MRTSARRESCDEEEEEERRVESGVQNEFIDYYYSRGLCEGPTSRLYN